MDNMWETDAISCGKGKGELMQRLKRTQDQRKLIYSGLAYAF